MILKNKIRLSRTLAAQTSPYPRASVLIIRGFFLIIFLLTLGIYFLTNSNKPHEQTELPKQILGEQENVSQPNYLLYTVKKGDTLFNLSQRYEVSWQTLVEVNNLEEPYILKIGQMLRVPAEK